jgi:hypothetical protein
VNGKLVSLPARTRELPTNTPKMQLAKIDLLEVLVEQNREMISLLKELVGAIPE